MNDLDTLTPYAVLLRYDFGVSESLSREQTVSLVGSVYVWASNLVNKTNRENL